MLTDAPRVILKLTNHTGESHEFVLGEGQHVTLTVPPPRLWPRVYEIEVVEISRPGSDAGG